MADPLAGNPEEAMDDLTAHLESALGTYTTSEVHDEFDLGDGSDLPPGHGLDRYRMHANEDTGFAESGLPLEHPNLTYGQLVAPSAHEDHGYRTAAAATPYAAATAQTGPSGSAPPLSGVPEAGAGVAGGLNEVQPAVRGGPAALGLALPRTPPAPLSFTVTDPVKRDQGGLFGLKAGHVTYLVTTTLRAPVPEFTRGPTFTVRRRFRDFVALATALKARHRGYFLPPRPERNAVEAQRMTDTFVEERRIALERYLNRLARHPVLATCPELRVFVEADGELESSPAWAAVAPAHTPAVGGLVEGTARLSKQLLGLEHSVLDPVQAAQPTKRTSDPLRALKETAQAMAHNGAAAPPLPPGEVELRKQREALEARQQALTLATRAAEKLVHRLDRVSLVQGDLGLALFKLSKAEEAEGPHLAQFTGTVRQSQSLAQGAKLLATSLVRVARLARRTVGRSAADLSALHDQLGGLPPALKGLSTREKQLLTLETLQADVDTRQRSIRELEVAGSKVLGGDASKAKRVEDLKNDVAKLECSISAAKAEYERIAGVNWEELRRTHNEYESDMLRMGLSWTVSQALGAQRTAEVWLQLANELGGPPEQLAQIRNSIVEASSVQQQVVGTSSAPAAVPAPPGLKLQIGGPASDWNGAGPSGTAGTSSDHTATAVGHALA